ncbi:MAG TPA: hypothetical protein VKP66_13660 [Steroidobacteraceae bacterium]|nr:hypothetical protein [Steroidobacteraceae bacterium]
MLIQPREPSIEKYFRDITGLSDLTDLHIPTGDREAFNRNPQHQWIYNRLLLAQSQGLYCGLHDERPRRFPVFCTALSNFDDRESGGCVLWSERDFLERCDTGKFWMQLLTGEHLSTDAAVVAGEIAWCRHALGIWGAAGSFDYWVVEEATRPRLERFCAGWIRANLAGYTGMVNLETIGGRISTARLRFSNQWPDLYGRRWLSAIIRLHQHGRWDLIDAERAEGYSLNLTGTLGSVSAHPHADSMRAYEATVGVSSIRLPSFDEDPEKPAGGCRLAVINCFNLQVGMRVRSALAREFGLPAGSYGRRNS